MSSPPTSQRATVRPRRSIERAWQAQLLPSVYLMSSSRAATPQVQRSPLVLRQSWSTEGASMPPSRIRVLPISTESPSRTLAVPVMSAACASDGSAEQKTAQSGIFATCRSACDESRCPNCGRLLAPCQALPGRGFQLPVIASRVDLGACTRSRAHHLSRDRVDRAERFSPRDLPPRHRPPRHRQPHQHEGRRHLRAADQNPRRRLHLVPFIGAERARGGRLRRTASTISSAPAQRPRVGAEMAERDQRQRRVEHVHLARPSARP